MGSKKAERIIILSEVLIIFGFLVFMQITSNTTRIKAERDCYLEHIRNIYTANGQDLNKLINRKVWKSDQDEKHFLERKEPRIRQLMESN